MIKLYPTGIEFLLSAFKEKEEFVAARFQEISEISLEEASEEIYKFIIKNFGKLMQSDLGKDSYFLVNTVEVFAFIKAAAFLNITQQDTLL